MKFGALGFCLCHRGTEEQPYSHRQTIMLLAFRLGSRLIIPLTSESLGMATGTPEHCYERLRAPVKAYNRSSEQRKTLAQVW